MTEPTRYKIESLNGVEMVLASVYDTLAAERDALWLEKQNMLSDCHEHMQDLTRSQLNLKEAKQQRDQAKADLKQFGGHLGGCAGGLYSGGELPCDCGFETALRDLEGKL